MAGIKSIGILTSGGDAPGMNAAIRAVTRSAIYNGFTVKGIMRGFKGLVFNEIVEFKSQSVSNIIQLGGTILKTARSEEFKTVEGRKAAYDNMVAAGIDALVVIGGDGSLTGAGLFAEEYNVPIVGASRNDRQRPRRHGLDDRLRHGAEYDHGVGRQTARHGVEPRTPLFVEVMGHTAGYLALNSAIATGSEAAIIPEMETEVDQLAELINHGFRKSKNSAIVIVAENPKTGGATALAERVKKEFPQYDARVTILGHIQRGGSPTAVDRILASRMGEAAIEAILDGQRNVMIGTMNGKIVYVPFAKAIKHDKGIDRGALELVKILSI